MSISIERCRDAELIVTLHQDLLPSDEIPEWDAAWVAWEEDRAVGFATAKLADAGTAMFLQRSGVRPVARGQGLQRRLIRVRERWARARGIRRSVTYTTYENHPSITNLIRSGYRFYTPDWKWAGDSHYFWRRLV